MNIPAEARWVQLGCLNGDQLYSVVTLYEAVSVTGKLEILDDESTALQYFPLDALPRLESRAATMLSWYKKHIDFTEQSSGLAQKPLCSG